jgi:hypothetical protein
MSNILGTFQDKISGAAGAIGYGGLKNTPFGRAVNSAVDGAFNQTKDQLGELRKAGQILKAHPAGAILTDMIFPEPMADGTLDAARARGALK